MRFLPSATLAITLGACAEAPPPARGIEGMPADLPESILTDVPSTERAEFVQVLEAVSSGLPGHCSEDEIALTLESMAIFGWFGYGTARSPDAIAYVESRIEAIAGQRGTISDACNRRLQEIGEQFAE